MRFPISPSIITNCAISRFRGAQEKSRKMTSLSMQEEFPSLFACMIPYEVSASDTYFATDLPNPIDITGEYNSTNPALEARAPPAAHARSASNPSSSHSHARHTQREQFIVICFYPKIVRDSTPSPTTSCTMRRRHSTARCTSGTTAARRPTIR